MTIRNSVKAVIIKKDKILLTKNKDAEGIFYLCPGGGQEFGETFFEALQRECLEEIGQNVEIGDLLFIREYIGKNHEFASSDFNVHQIEFYFACQLSKRQNSSSQPTHPDFDQVGMEWRSIHDLFNVRLYPKNMRQQLIDYANEKKASIYLGDIN